MDDEEQAPQPLKSESEVKKELDPKEHIQNQKEQDYRLEQQQAEIKVEQNN